MFYVLKLSGEGTVLTMHEAMTHGLATQKAHEFTDEGYPARVVPEELKDDCLFYMDQVREKKDNGFIKEYGVVPNGSRSKGEGARSVGRMIFPAFNGRLEGLEGGNGNQSQPGQGESKQELLPLPLTFPKKNKKHVRKYNPNSILTINI